MMMGLNTVTVVAMSFILAADMAHAQGDPKRGEKVFENCHA
jgi:hypothetical protein